MPASARVSGEMAMSAINSKEFRIAAIITLALFSRFLLMLLFKTYQFESEWEYGFEFARIARWLLAGEGFSTPYYEFPKPSANQAPVYVYFIAFIFSNFGIYSTASAVIIETIQAVVDVVTCVLFYSLGRQIFNDTVGFVGGLALALYPPSMFFAVVRVEPVVLIVCLLALVVHCLLKLPETRSYRLPAVCGLLMGVAVLVEPTLALFFVFSYAWVLFYSAGRRVVTARRLLTMGLVSVLVTLPWMIRNYAVFGTIVPIKSNFGANLLFGNNPYGNGVFQYTKGFYSVEERERIRGRREGAERLRREEIVSDEERQMIRKVNEVEGDKLMGAKAKAFIAAHPQRFLQLTLRRIVAFWSPINPYRTTRYDVLRGFVYGIPLVLAIAGIVLARRKHRRETSLILLFFVTYPLSYYVTHVSMYRYRFPVEPFLILFCSYAVVEVLTKIREKRGAVGPLLAH